jgi:phosphopentomutase
LKALGCGTVLINELGRENVKTGRSIVFRFNGLNMDIILHKKCMVK